MKKVLLTVALVLVATSAFALITNSKHDFTTTGGGNAYNRSLETQLCVYCHTPHNANSSALLWNRNAAAAVTVYNKAISSTLNFDAIVGIGTVSKLCLSCHDGTIAVDSFGGVPGSKTVTATANIGSDLTNDHPIGFSYATAGGAAGDIKNTATLPMFTNGTLNDSMECATCHDVHAKTQAKDFLRINNDGSGLCLNCHSK